MDGLLKQNKMYNISAFMVINSHGIYVYGCIIYFSKIGCMICSLCVAILILIKILVSNDIYFYMFSMSFYLYMC